MGREGCWAAAILEQLEGFQELCLEFKGVLGGEKFQDSQELLEPDGELLLIFFL